MSSINLAASSLASYGPYTPLTEVGAILVSRVTYAALNRIKSLASTSIPFYASILAGAVTLISLQAVCVAAQLNPLQSLAIAVILLVSYRFFLFILNRPAILPPPALPGTAEIAKNTHPKEIFSPYTLELQNLQALLEQNKHVSLKSSSLEDAQMLVSELERRISAKEVGETSPLLAKKIYATSALTPQLIAAVTTRPPHSTILVVPNPISLSNEARILLKSLIEGGHCQFIYVGRMTNGLASDKQWANYFESLNPITLQPLSKEACLEVLKSKFYSSIQLKKIKLPPENHIKPETFEYILQKSTQLPATYASLKMAFDLIENALLEIQRHGPSYPRINDTTYIDSLLSYASPLLPGEGAEGLPLLGYAAEVSALQLLLEEKQSVILESNHLKDSVLVVRELARKIRDKEVSAHSPLLASSLFTLTTNFEALILQVEKSPPLSHIFLIEDISQFSQAAFSHLRTLIQEKKCLFIIFQPHSKFYDPNQHAEIQSLYALTKQVALKPLDSETCKKILLQRCTSSPLWASKPVPHVAAPYRTFDYLLHLNPKLPSSYAELLNTLSLLDRAFAKAKATAHVVEVEMNPAFIDLMLSSEFVPLPEASTIEEEDLNSGPLLGYATEFLALVSALKKHGSIVLASSALLDAQKVVAELARQIKMQQAKEPSMLAEMTVYNRSTIYSISHMSQELSEEIAKRPPYSSILFIENLSSFSLEEQRRVLQLLREKKGLFIFYSLPPHDLLQELREWVEKNNPMILLKPFTPDLCKTIILQHLEQSKKGSFLLETPTLDALVAAVPYPTYASLQETFEALDEAIDTVIAKKELATLPDGRVSGGLEKALIFEILQRKKAAREGASPPSTLSFKLDPLVLYDKLNTRVLDQTHATKIVSEALVNFAAGISNPKKPIKVLLFLGPSGVGKTELAKVLAEEMYINPKAYYRIDMSHYAEPHSFARLIGSPPGYVNHEEGGQLTERLKQHPGSVVLLDEVEKSHPHVQKVFLPVFDDGYIEDTKKNHVDCTQAVFILTSNLCAHEIATLSRQNLSLEEILKRIEPLLMKALSPELYNRTEPVVFFPLQSKVMSSLVDLKISELSSRIQRTKRLSLTCDQNAKEYLMREGYHLELGARPLARVIEATVVSTLAKTILQEKPPAGSSLTVKYTPDSKTWSASYIPGNPSKFPSSVEESKEQEEMAHNGAAPSAASASASARPPRHPAYKSKAQNQA